MPFMPHRLGHDLIVVLAGFGPCLRPDESEAQRSTVASGPTMEDHESHGHRRLRIGGIEV